MLCAAAATLTVAGFVLNAVFERQFQSEFDQGLQAKAETLAILTTQQGGKVKFDFADELMPAYEALENPEYFELRFSDGSILEKSRSLGDDTLLDGIPLDQLPLRQAIKLPGGRDGRISVIRIVPHMVDSITNTLNGASRSTDPTTGRPLSDIQIVLAVAKGTESLVRLDSLMHWVLGTSAFALLLTLGALMFLVIRHSLGPLNTIANAVSELDTADLHARITTPEVSDEVLPIVTRINEMLQRLENAFDKEKRFSSNVAHELKTPIAALRSLVEVAQQWPDDKVLIERYLGRLVGVAERMDATVSTLLLLARLDGRQQSIELEPVSLKDLILEAEQANEETAQRRKITFTCNVRDDLFITSDKEELRIIISNLVSNSIAYATEGSAVRIDTSCTDGHCEMQIENPATELSEADIPAMFDRFWRHDEARSDSQHSGLGLALVKALCENLGYAVEAKLIGDNRFVVTLRGLAIAVSD